MKVRKRSNDAKSLRTMHMAHQCHSNGNGVRSMAKRTKWNREIQRKRWNEMKQPKKKKKEYCKSISFENQMRWLAPSRTAPKPERNEWQKKTKEKKMCGKCNWNFRHSQGDTDNGKDQIKGNPLDGGDGAKKKVQIYIFRHRHCDCVWRT